MGRGSSTALEGGVKVGNGNSDEDKTITLNIPMSMYNWLSNEGKNINRSELFRQAVMQKMKPEKVSSLVFLVSVMGIVFSISILGIALTPSPIHFYARAIMALMAGFLALATTTTYLKERKKSKEKNKSVLA
jgi:hypothetical protein